jgi:hypothetical protein
MQKLQTSMQLNAAEILAQVSRQGNILEDTTATADNLKDTVTTAVNTSCESFVPSGAPESLESFELALLRSRLQHLERHLVSELPTRGPERMLEKLAILKSGLKSLERFNRSCTNV